MGSRNRRTRYRPQVIRLADGRKLEVTPDGKVYARSEDRGPLRRVTNPVLIQEAHAAVRRLQREARERREAETVAGASE